MGASLPSSTKRRARSEINVTPFVDVMLVLLIIFMVAAPMMQQGIEVNLPETRTTGVSSSDDKPFLVVIRSNGSIYFGDTPIQVDSIKKKISAIFETRKNKTVYLQADKQVNYGVVATVMAEIKASGITSIGLITIPKN